MNDARCKPDYGKGNAFCREAEFIPSNLKRFGQRVLVWMVALAAMVQTVGQAIASYLDGRGDLLVLWLLMTGAAALEAS